jgi:hypothetical protein
MNDSPDWMCRGCECGIPDKCDDVLTAMGVTFVDGEPAYCADCEPDDTDLDELCDCKRPYRHCVCDQMCASAEER